MVKGFNGLAASVLASLAAKGIGYAGKRAGNYLFPKSNRTTRGRAYGRGTYKTKMRKIPKKRTGGRYQGKKKVYNKKRKNWKKENRLKLAASTVPWKTYKVSYAATLNVLSGSLTPWEGITVGQYFSGILAGNRPYYNGVNYSTDLHYAIHSIIADVNPDISPSLLQMKESTVVAEMRNNGNIACNLQFYKYRPRRDSDEILTEGYFSETWLDSLSTHSITDPSPHVTPFDLKDFTQRMVITKSWKVRLLPGEKYTCRLSLKNLVGKTDVLGNTENPIKARYTKYIGMLARGDPSHENLTQTTVSTSPVKLDIIRMFTITARPVALTTVNPFTQMDNLSALTKPVFNTIEANETTEFDTTAP